jgi:hypothetical protein
MHDYKGVVKMEVIYIKEHNNYDLVLGQKYSAIFYKKGWLLVEVDYMNKALLREESFKAV